MLTEALLETNRQGQWCIYSNDHACVKHSPRNSPPVIPIPQEDRGTPGEGEDALAGGDIKEHPGQRADGQAQSRRPWRRRDDQAGEWDSPPVADNRLRKRSHRPIPLSHGI